MGTHRFPHKLWDPGIEVNLVSAAHDADLSTDEQQGRSIAQTKPALGQGVGQLLGLFGLLACAEKLPSHPKYSSGGDSEIDRWFAGLNQVVESVSGPWCLRAYLQVDAATGCRRGELLALRWSDLVDGCAIIARSLTQTRKGLEFKGTKTEKPRLVVLPESAITTLAAHRRQQDEFRGQFGPDYRADLDLVFANPDGTPLKPDSISASVSALFKRLKIPKPKGAALHLLRHSHTSILLAAGVPLPAVSARLGHSSVRTTQDIYAHMITGQDEEAARKWEEFQALNKAAKPENRKENVQ